MTKPFIPLLFVMLFTAYTATVFSQASAKRYVKVPAGYLMVLKQGDDVFQQLETFAIAEKIPSCNFTGMGFVETTFGFFNFKTKQYKSKHFKAGELAAMQGTLAWQENKPSIHAHGLITTKKFKAFGGHLLSAIVGTGTLEIMIMVHDQRFERKKDPVLGANVLCIDQCGQP